MTRGAAPEPALPGACVEIEGVERIFGGIHAVAPLSLSLGAGEFVAILGPSGCGKSTLLRLIAGLDTPDRGAVRIDGQPPGAAAKLSFVFQDPHLLPWRTVLQNAALPLELQGVDRGARVALAREVLALTGLAEAEGVRPAELSGGMRMRVSLSRALVTRPRLLLLDEPFAALDELTRQALDDHLRALWAASGMTVVFVTHSIAEATYLADRAVVFSPRPGRIVHDQAIALPRVRTPALRVDPTFVQIERRLFEALAGGD